MVKKSMGTAFVLWLLLGGFGAHRIYIKESPLTFLWYWLAVAGTLTIILWIDLFMLKKWIERDYEKKGLRGLYQ